MKRFLAMFAIMAMIVSMFSGVAFAEELDPVKVDLTDDVLYYGGSTQRYTIEGSIRDANEVLDSSRAGDAVVITLDGDTTPSAISFTNKTIETDGTFAASALGLPIGNYEVDVDEATTPASFVVVPHMELETPTSLDFDYPVSDEVYITGVFVDGNGPKSTSNDEVWIGTEDNILAKANYANEDSFGFLFDGEKFANVGDIALYYVVGGGTVNDPTTADNVVKTDITGEVKASSLDFTISPTRLTRGIDLGAQEVTITTDLASKFFNDDGELSGYTFSSVKLKDGTTVVATATIDTSDFDYTQEDTTDFTKSSQKFTATLDVDNVDAGNYTLEVILSDGSVDAYKGTTDLRVDRPQRYTLVDWDETALTTNTTTFGFEEATRNVEVVYAQSSTTSSAIEAGDYGYYKVTYSGAGLAETVKYSVDSGETDAADTFDITPKETGVIEFTIEVFDTDDTRLASFTRELEVKGMNVSLSETEVTVDMEYDLVVTVTDDAGVPLNNAKVTIEGEPFVDATTDNIIDGNYIFEDFEATTVEDLDVTVEHKPGDYETVTKTLKVVGQDVYTVESETSVLLNGIEEVIYVSVYNEDGDAVYANFEVLEYNSKDKLISDDAVYTVSGTKYDRDEDGVKESSKLTVTPHEDAVEMIVRAESTNRKEKGDATIEVVKPEIVHTGANAITENFETMIEFTVVDPRDDSLMEDLTLELSNSIVFDADVTPAPALTDMVEENLTADIEDVWTAEFKITDVEWDLEDEDDVNEVDIMMGDVKLGSVEVKKATIESNPEVIIINAPTRLVLTYSDADGNPIEGKSVKLDDVEIGKTDENGQVEYSASSTSSVSLTFKAATDVTGKTVSKSVKSSADVDAPEASIEVSGNTAVITISDNVRVSKALVNGEPVDMFFPMSSVPVPVTLSSGVNTFNVQAVDINNNYSVTTLTAEPEVVEADLEFTIGEASEYGTPVMMDGTTMVPVRFAESLGATVTWDAPTATVTYTVGDDVIELTEGSTTAVVNGANVQLRVAPYMNTELYRLMVPLRMISEELGFTVTFTSVDAPITITK